MVDSILRQGVGFLPGLSAIHMLCVQSAALIGPFKRE